jgi:hypothetical protein
MSDERLYCSDWSASFGNPYLEPPGTAPDVDLAPVVEDGGVSRARDVPPGPGVTLVFVDRVRRMQAHSPAPKHRSAHRRSPTRAQAPSERLRSGG